MWRFWGVCRVAALPPLAVMLLLMLLLPALRTGCIGLQLLARLRLLLPLAVKLSI
jgi:hypothetical protein